MSLDIQMYQASPVEAVQVSWDNAEDVAEWANGKVLTKAVDEISGNKLITIHIPQKWQARIFPAHIGDWVIKEESGKFRVFKEKIFGNVFHNVEFVGTDVNPEDEKKASGVND